MQSNFRVIDLGGGEGEAHGGVAEGGGGGEGCSICDGLLEERLGLAGAVEAEEGVGTVGEEGGVEGLPGLGLLRDQFGVDGIGLVGVAGFDVEAGEEASDGCVFGMGGVEGVDERDGFGDLCVIVRGDISGGELGGEGGVAGVLGEGGGDEGFGVSGAGFAEEDGGEGGGDGGIGWVEREVAGVGVLGGGEIVGGRGEFGGEEDVVGLLGGELEGVEEVLRRLRWRCCLDRGGRGLERRGL